MTSHAAIVSRELSIPCVVGTRIATKVLHTGLVVTVNARDGTIVEGALGPSAAPNAVEHDAGGTVPAPVITATRIYV